MVRLLSLTVLSLFFFSCSSSVKVVKFPKKQDEIFANRNLKAFFKANPSPNFVLRVPNTADRATSNTNLGGNENVLYNAIEKELLKQGFSVRDRGLFNEIINKSESTDYSKIKDLTNTDLILEVVNIDAKVLYTTNKVTEVGKKKSKEVVGNQDYRKYGASAEFRLIMVSTNEISGTYKYNYEPCPNGCQLNSFSFSGKRSNKTVELRESVAVNILEEFMQSSTRDLINSFKQ